MPDSPYIPLVGNTIYFWQHTPTNRDITLKRTHYFNVYVLAYVLYSKYDNLIVSVNVKLLSGVNLHPLITPIRYNPLVILHSG